MILNDREVEIQIDDVTVVGSPDKAEYVEIEWSGNIGFGVYTLWKNSSGKWKADSECMDRGEDKKFIRLLLDKFVKELEIAE